VRVLEGTGNFGFDALRNEYVDLVQAGTIDPTKVVRNALENAVAVAGVLLLTAATITEIGTSRREPGGGAEMEVQRRRVPLRCGLTPGGR
jgi:chaperonin GroEL